MSCLSRWYDDWPTRKLYNRSLYWLWFILWLLWFMCLIYRRIEAILNTYKLGTKAASNTTAQWASTVCNCLMNLIFWLQQPRP